ncbi:MAG TPA: hypothetical protein VLH19_02205 [Patescibacteria group bacterium]|nr:hypothetical protein [Patescibacteria group bacterium]
MKIRAFELEDAEAVSSLIGTPEYNVPNVLWFAGRENIYVAKIGKKIVGVGSIKNGQIHMLYVARQERGTGVDIELTSFLERIIQN